MKYLKLSNWKVSFLFTTALIILSAVNTGLYSQTSPCALSCTGTVQVSLNSSCDAEITANMILSDNGVSCLDGTFSVVVHNDMGPISGGNIVSNAYMGQTLQVLVTDTNSGNFCWGNIIIEDKLGPTITNCPVGFVNLDCADLNTFVGPDFTDNCDGPLTPVLLTEEVTAPCNAAFIREVTRVYSATDNLGNVAANTCSVTLRLRRFNPNRVRFPDSLQISCDLANSFDANGNGKVDEGELPSSEFGVPFYILVSPDGMRDTVDLFPFPDVFCNTTVTLTDVVLPRIGCSQKVLRRFRINEWHCLGSTDTTFTQLIEILDNEGPALTCIPSLTFSTNTLIPGPGGDYNNFSCGADVRIPLPQASDNCSDDLEFDIAFNTGFINDYKGENIELPIGTNVVLFTVSDECFNSSTCHIAIDIQDNTPPVPICDQNLTVSLTNGGSAVVRASSFDDGSYDDCKLNCKLVRRMETSSCPCRIPEFCDMNFIGTRDGSYYYLSDETLSATIAAKRAEAYGGSLVLFETPEEEQWVTAQVRQTFSDRYWTGVVRDGSAFRFPDHTLIPFANWMPGQPSLGEGEDCVMVTPANQWNDASCLSEQRFVVEITDICTFSNTVSFCCEDVGSNQMVALRILDAAGNFNDCMININIQDKSAPRLDCPTDMTVECDRIVDINNLSTSFGFLEIGESCGSNIRESVLDDLNECGIGTITRLYEAVSSDEPNAEILAHCKQIITFVNTDPFPADDIICPEPEIFIDGCDSPNNFGPDITGVPEFTTGVCNRLGTDFDDKLFTFNNDSGDACFKILRTWTIADWCRIDPATGTFFEKTCNQVIQISNSGRPLISGDQKISICTFDDCETGDVTLVVRGEDDCTLPENLSWRYEIFVGSISSFPTSLSVPDIAVNGDGDVIDASGNYPLGNHIIRYTLMDGCGNTTISEQEFTIANCKAPTVYCLNGVAVDLSGVDEDGDGIDDFGRVELWANDFDAGSFHPCGYPVLLSFSADTEDRNMIFDCSRLGLRDVNIWASVVTPTGELVQTFCSTFIDIQDNMGLCQGLSVAIDGSIFTEEERTVENVEVALAGTPMSDITEADGTYAFPSMPAGGNYVVDPYSNANPENGIDTRDLIRIQRHILGLEQLDSPYKYIAADINQSNRIDGADVVELRKLILGLYNEFPNNTSWRFIEKDFEFSTNINPLEVDFPEKHEIVNLADNSQVNFIAVKIGDVDGSAIVNQNDTGKKSNNGSINLELSSDSQSYNSGEMIKMPLNLDTEMDLAGFQFDLVYDNSKIEILDVTGTGISLDANNYSVTDNSIKLSWNGEASGNSGIEIHAIAKTTISNPAELISVKQNSPLQSAIYGTNDDLLIPNVIYSTDQVDWISKNIPNPFSDLTQVTVVLEKNSQVQVSITDISGRLVMQETNLVNAGSHIIEITSEQLGEAGIYYMTVQTETKTETIKMVLVD